MAVSVSFSRLVSVVVLLVTLVLVLAPLPAVAEDKDQCKNGGWSTLQDAAGNAFKNQGQCVSYVAQGGEFATVGSIDLALALATFCPGGCIAYTITGSDLAPGTDVTLMVTQAGGGTPAVVVGQVLADGTVFIQSGQAGIGWFPCRTVTALAVSALAADGTTTVTDTASLPC